jgi:hypothetical protein
MHNSALLAEAALPIGVAPFARGVSVAGGVGERLRFGVMC